MSQHFLSDTLTSEVSVCFFDLESPSDHVQPGPSPHHPGRDDPERTHRGDEQEPRARTAHRSRQDGRQLRLTNPQEVMSQIEEATLAQQKSDGPC